MAVAGFSSSQAVGLKASGPYQLLAGGSPQFLDRWASPQASWPPLQWASQRRMEAWLWKQHPIASAMSFLLEANHWLQPTHTQEVPEHQACVDRWGHLGGSLSQDASRGFWAEGWAAPRPWKLPHCLERG